MEPLHEYLNSFITDKLVIGMGSGSTIEGYIPSIKAHIEKNHLNIQFVPTSVKTEKALHDHQLKVTFDTEEIDFTIDGANQFTADLNAVKGGGGSLLREKQIGYFSKHIIIAAKKTKETPSFEGVKIPVEINPFLMNLTKLEIMNYGASLSDRMDGDTLFTSDNGNYIVDCTFEKIDDLNVLQNQLLNIPGVIETGIFNHYIKQVVSFDDNGITVYERSRP